MAKKKQVHQGERLRAAVKLKLSWKVDSFAKMVDRKSNTVGTWFRSEILSEETLSLIENKTSISREFILGESEEVSMNPEAALKYGGNSDLEAVTNWNRENIILLNEKIETLKSLIVDNQMEIRRLKNKKET